MLKNKLTLPRIARLALIATLFAVEFAMAQTGKLSNISTRSQVLTGNDVLIGGFVIVDAPLTVVVRARGPSLVPFGITNALANPTLQLVRSSDQVTIATNDDWGSALNAGMLSSSGFAPSDPLEAAILVTLAPGAYTAIVSGLGGGTGVGIVEVFVATTVNVNQANSARLLGGSWTFLYTVFSTSQDTYTLTSIDATPTSSGEYYVRGTDTFGGPVIAGFYPPGAVWILLDPGAISIMDRYFVFSFSDNNHISGCFYQTNPRSINPPPCYAMTGVRSPLIASSGGSAKYKTPDVILVDEVAARNINGFVQEGAIEAYLSARERLNSQQGFIAPASINNPYGAGNPYSSEPLYVRPSR